MISMASGDPQNRQNLASARRSVFPHDGQARSVACLNSVRDAESRTLAAPGSAAPQWRQKRLASSDSWPHEGHVFIGCPPEFEGNLNELIVADSRKLQAGCRLLLVP